MKLYYTPGACSLAPHIVLREAGESPVLEKVDLRQKKTETGADFNAINAKGYVPVLQLDTGELLTEGIVIQQYIADRSPETGLAPPRGSAERLRLEELLVFISTEIHKSYNPLLSPTMPDDAKSTFRDKIGKHYALVEDMLADGRPYLTGDRFTIADAYLYVLSTWSKSTAVDLSRWPRVEAFVERVGERPAVQAARTAEGLAAKH